MAETYLSEEEEEEEEETYLAGKGEEEEAQILGGVVVGQLVGLVHGIHADLPQQKLSHPVVLGESLGFRTLEDDHQHSAWTCGDMMVVFHRCDSH